MADGDAGGIEHIEADLKSSIVCSNLNRVCIIHLLSKTPDQEMQAEKMAYSLGLSHRTVLYHLDVLFDHGLVEVRRFRKRGAKLMRSVWGLKNGHGHLDRVLNDISSNFNCRELDKAICKNAAHQ